MAFLISKTNPRRIVFRLGLMSCVLALAGCNFPTQVQEELVATAVAATLAPPTEPAAPAVLPATLLFLSERSGSAQIWQLARDGETQKQLTDEVAGVEGFDVSPADGSLAYVSGNQLYLRAADGSNRRLMVDNAAADRSAAEYFSTQRISNPRFSPDGRYLAYAYAGLWILDLGSNQAVHLLNNEIDAESEALQTYYVPLAWAPNSQQLVLASGGPAGAANSSRLVFVNPGADTLTTTAQTGVGPACCHAAWTPDSAGLLLASPYTGLLEPGLWRYDPLSGERSSLLAGEEGLLELAGWPLQTAEGELYFFYASTADLPAGDLPLFMVRSPADQPTERELLRAEAFTNMGEALWAQDGSLALVVQVRPEGGRGGAVLLAYSDGRQPQRLLEDGYALQWGH